MRRDGAATVEKWYGGRTLRKVQRERVGSIGTVGVSKGICKGKM